MSDFPQIKDTHPAGMVRVELGEVWMTEADLDYITGSLVEHGVQWEDFAKRAILEAAAR